MTEKRKPLLDWGVEEMFEKVVMLSTLVLSDQNEFARNQIRRFVHDQLSINGSTGKVPDIYLLTDT